MKNQKAPKKRMTIDQAALYMAEMTQEEALRIKIDIYSPFPPLQVRTEVCTVVKRWRNRIRQATAGAELACTRVGSGLRAQALYSELDLEQWARDCFPREEAI